MLRALKNSFINKKHGDTTDALTHNTRNKGSRKSLKFKNLKKHIAMDSSFNGLPNEADKVPDNCANNSMKDGEMGASSAIPVFSTPHVPPLSPHGGDETIISPILQPEKAVISSSREKLLPKLEINGDAIDGNEKRFVTEYTVRLEPTLKIIIPVEKTSYKSNVTIIPDQTAHVDCPAKSSNDNAQVEGSENLPGPALNSKSQSSINLIDFSPEEKSRKTLIQKEEKWDVVNKETKLLPDDTFKITLGLVGQISSDNPCGVNVFQRKEKKSNCCDQSESINVETNSNHPLQGKNEEFSVALKKNAAIQASDNNSQSDSEASEEIVKFKDVHEAVYKSSVIISKDEDAPMSQQDEDTLYAIREDSVSFISKEDNDNNEDVIVTAEVISKEQQNDVTTIAVTEETIISETGDVISDTTGKIGDPKEVIEDPKKESISKTDSHQWDNEDSNVQFLIGDLELEENFTDITENNLISCHLTTSDKQLLNNLQKKLEVEHQDCEAVDDTKDTDELQVEDEDIDCDQRSEKSEEKTPIPCSQKDVEFSSEQNSPNREDGTISDEIAKKRSNSMTAGDVDSVHAEPVPSPISKEQILGERKNEAPATEDRFVDIYDKEPLHPVDTTVDNIVPKNTMQFTSPPSTANSLSKANSKLGDAGRLQNSAERWEWMKKLVENREMERLGHSAACADSLQSSTNIIDHQIDAEPPIASNLSIDPHLQKLLDCIDRHNQVQVKTTKSKGSHKSENLNVNYELRKVLSDLDKRDSSTNQNSRKAPPLKLMRRGDEAATMKLDDRSASSTGVKKQRTFPQDRKSIASIETSSIRSVNTVPDSFGRKCSINDCVVIRQLDAADDIIKSFKNRNDRRLRAVAAKNSCEVNIIGPIVSVDYLNGQPVRKGSYECEIKGPCRARVTRCLNFLQETFPNSNMKIRR